MKYYLLSVLYQGNVPSIIMTSNKEVSQNTSDDGVTKSSSGERYGFFN